MSGRSRCIHKDLKRNTSSRDAERIAGQRKVASSTVKVCQESVVENVDLVQVDAANEVVAAASDIADFQCRFASEFTLNADTVLLDHRYLDLWIDREDRSEEIRVGVVLQIRDRRCDERRSTDRWIAGNETAVLVYERL